MGRFVVEYNRDGHQHPYGDRRAREVLVPSSYTDLNLLCSFVVGTVWSGASLEGNRYWRVVDAKPTHKGATCEVRWAGQGGVQSHYVNVEGDVQPAGPW